MERKTCVLFVESLESVEFGPVLGGLLQVCVCVCVCVEAGASDSQPEGRGRTGGALGTGIGIRVPFG